MREMVNFSVVCYSTHFNYDQEAQNPSLSHIYPPVFLVSEPAKCKSYTRVWYHLKVKSLPYTMDVIMSGQRRATAHFTTVNIWKTIKIAGLLTFQGYSNIHNDEGAWCIWYQNEGK